VRIHCRSCGKKLKYAKEQAGTRVQCASCAKPIRLPPAPEQDNRQKAGSGPPLLPNAEKHVMTEGEFVGDIIGVLFLAAAGAGGAIGGAIVAFFATAYACVFVDWIVGEGPCFVAVGWLFCLGTVPMGLYFGACIGIYLWSLLVLDDDI